MLDKQFVEANKDKFVGAEILDGAYQKLVGQNRDEAINAAVKLYAKEYQTLREIKDLKDKLAKAEASLVKTQEKVAKVKAGDLSALFEGNDKPTEQ